MAISKSQMKRLEVQGVDMNLQKIYHDSEGNKCNILEIIKKEPEWAANIIQHYEAANQDLRKKLMDIISKIVNIGHNNDCLFCGFKDREAKEARMGYE